jgi:hypothetical protein
MNQAEIPAPELENALSPEELFRSRLKMGLVGAGLFIFFVGLLYFSPVVTGFDWTVLQDAVYRTVTGQEIYQTENAVLNPPWFFLLLSPVGLLPERLGWAVMNALNGLAIVLLSRRYHLSVAHLALLLISPPFLYNLIQGQTDAVILLAVFLPTEYLPLAAVMKPQLVLPLGLKVFHYGKGLWLKSFLISAAILGLSFLIFGFWPPKILETSRLLTDLPVGHNVLQSIWPLPIILAVPLVLLGLEQKDERFYLAAAPLLSRYASTGNFIGVLLVAMTKLKWWQALGLVLAWWIVPFIR